MFNFYGHIQVSFQTSLFVQQGFSSCESKHVSMQNSSNGVVGRKFSELHEDLDIARLFVLSVTFARQVSTKLCSMYSTTIYMYIMTY